MNSEESNACSLMKSTLTAARSFSPAFSTFNSILGDSLVNASERIDGGEAL